jgi:hypothetical protein
MQVPIPISENPLILQNPVNGGVGHWKNALNPGLNHSGFLVDRHLDGVDLEIEKRVSGDFLEGQPILRQNKSVHCDLVVMGPSRPESDNASRQLICSGLCFLGFPSFAEETWRFCEGQQGAE